MKKQDISQLKPGIHFKEGKHDYVCIGIAKTSLGDSIRGLQSNSDYVLKIHPQIYDTCVYIIVAIKLSTLTEPNIDHYFDTKIFCYDENHNTLIGDHYNKSFTINAKWGQHPQYKLIYDPALKDYISSTDYSMFIHTLCVGDINKLTYKIVNDSGIDLYHQHVSPLLKSVFTITNKFFRKYKNIEYKMVIYPYKGKSTIALFINTPNKSLFETNAKLFMLSENNKVMVFNLTEQKYNTYHTKIISYPTYLTPEILKLITNVVQYYDNEQIDI